MESLSTGVKHNWKAATTFVMLYVGYVVCYIDRSAMNIALSYIGKDLHLSTVTLGVVSSAFFFSYALMQIPGGWLTDKFGTVPTVTFAIAMWSVFTVMTGLAWSLVSLVLIRVMFGIGEGCYPSASMKQVTESTTYKQRSQATATLISSNYVGAALAPMLVSPMIAYLGWRGAFHVMGIIGILFVVFYLLFGRPKKNKPKRKKKKRRVSSITRYRSLRLLAVRLFGSSLPLFSDLVLSRKDSILGCQHISYKSVILTWPELLGWCHYHRLLLELGQLQQAS